MQTPISTIILLVGFVWGVLGMIAILFIDNSYSGLGYNPFRQHSFKQACLVVFLSGPIIWIAGLFVGLIMTPITFGFEKLILPILTRIWKSLE
jgi:hypothetical protein